ncbi:MAG: DNA (cytosine-5-)-methyltransferase [Oscillospiraceae bacterium]|nr:DNA (cytosine-5-)-methyltransferase [Oscillospiraceae bacterium]
MLYKIIDLCAGIGGIRRGFELTGKVTNVLSAENDKYACMTYKHLYGENPTNDITTDKFKNIVNKIKYDILLAGFPCQSFSAVGKKEGFKDNIRGTIFFHIADILESTRPKAFLLENVEGLLNNNKGKTFQTILDTLINKLEYKLVGVTNNDKYNFIFNKNDIVLNAKNFGLPQNRPRVYIVGFDARLYGQDKLNNVLHKINFEKLPQKKNGDPIYSNLHNLLELGAPEEYYLSQGYFNTLKKHKTSQSEKGNGFGYVIVNSPDIENPISNTILATGGSGKERNLVYDPQERLYGKKVKNKVTHINNEGIRFMKPSEWAKLQGFIGYAFMKNGIETFSFSKAVSKTQQYKQLGNSVAIPLIEQLAIKIIETLDIMG